ncbi:hypothetical protein L1887_31686 [Cichorium endivia]|nr:hypothetical protein L1887_31686 [Cichorium endivia]
MVLMSRRSKVLLSIYFKRSFNTYLCDSSSIQNHLAPIYVKIACHPTNLINTGFKILYRKRTNQTLQENSPIRTLATDLHLHKSTLLQSSSTNIYNNLQFTIKILKK